MRKRRTRHRACLVFVGVASHSHGVGQNNGGALAFLFAWGIRSAESRGRERFGMQNAKWREKQAIWEHGGGTGACALDTPRQAEPAARRV